MDSLDVVRHWVEFLGQVSWVYTMDNQFWIDRWQNKETGWHRDNVHPLLFKLSEEFFEQPQQIFVPLCGKSLDMVWLAEKGHEIIGVELSPLAIEEFFEEQKLVPKKNQLGDFLSWQAGSYQILEGDFFNLTADFFAGNFKSCHCWYDRAAVIALPESLRNKYVEVIQMILPGARGLLISLSYDSASRQGPPFSLGDNEIKALWSAARKISAICTVASEIGKGKGSGQLPAFKPTNVTEHAFEICL